MADPHEDLEGEQDLGDMETGAERDTRGGLEGGGRGFSSELHGASPTSRQARMAG